MDGHSTIWIIVSIIILLVFSAFFSGTETAFSSASKIRLKSYSHAGDRRAKRALKVSERFENALSALLIGNNIVNIAAASLGTVLFTRLVGEKAGPVVSTVVLTVVVLIFGEVLPKSMAKAAPEPLAMRSAGVLDVLIKVFYPLIWVLQKIVKLFSRGDAAAQPSVTEEELKVIIEEIEDEGVLNENESELVQSAIEFDDITVDEILKPRVDVEAVEITEDPEKIKEIFFSTGYSRLPVYEKSIDHIIGVINQKDFIRSYVNDPAVDIRPLMQKVIFVPPKKRIAELMKELQRSRLHIAVVSDPFGGTIGIITLEDIIEELVGEIWDESDHVVPDFETLSENHYRVNGDMNVYDFFEELEMEDAYDGLSQAMSAWALEVFERIPEEGESFSHQNLHIRVEHVDEQRITSFLVDYDPVQEQTED